jgi:transposase-like protein
MKKLLVRTFHNSRGKDKGRINWVAVAAEMAGGVQSLAGRLGVSRWTIYKWIDRGTMRTISYETVMKLHQSSGVPVEKLTQD